MTDLPFERTAVILGSPKSGTSVTAGVVHHLGFAMGRELRAADERNPRGYYEDVEIMALHDNVLRTAGGSSWDLPADGAIDAIISQFSAELETLISDRNAGGSTWGVKTGPALLPYLLPLVRRPHLILVTRNPLDTATSAVNHVNRPDFNLIEALGHGAETLRRCVEIIESNDVPTSIISYEDLTKDPEVVVGRLADDLGVDDPEKVASAVAVVASRSRIQHERVTSRRRGQAEKTARSILQLPRRVVRRVVRLIR